MADKKNKKTTPKKYHHQELSQKLRLSKKLKKGRQVKAQKRLFMIQAWMEVVLVV